MEKLIVRMATPEDAAKILEIYGPIIRETAISFEMEIPAVDAFAQRIATYLKTHPWLVGEMDGAIAGYAYASMHRSRAAYQWSCETSAYVHPNFKRKQIGQKLSLVLNDILRKQGFFNAYAGIVVPNPESVAFHESLGYVHLGTYHQTGFKLGKWHSVSWYQLKLQPEGALPGKLLHWSEVGLNDE